MIGLTSIICYIDLAAELCIAGLKDNDLFRLDRSGNDSVNSLSNCDLVQGGTELIFGLASLENILQ
jgi:hypothetical protein